MSVASRIAERAAQLGLSMIEAVLAGRKGPLLEYQGSLAPARAPDALDLGAGLSTIARFGGVRGVTGRVLALLELQMGERALIARDLLDRNFYEGELLQRLREAAGLDPSKSLVDLIPAGTSPVAFCKERLAAQTGYGSIADLERFAEQFSLGAMLELAAFEPTFAEFLETDKGHALLFHNAELFHAARLPRMAWLFARVLHERAPTLSVLELLCEIALDAEAPQAIDEAWFEPFGEAARDLRTYVRLRSAMTGDVERFKSGNTPGHRSAVALIDLGIAPGTPEIHVAQLKRAIAADPHWRYAHSILVEVEARRAEGEILVPFQELNGYVDRHGNDFWTWQKALLPSGVYHWKVPAIRLLGREVEASPDHADLWRQLLSQFCNEDEYRAGLAIIAARLAEQQRI